MDGDCEHMLEYLGEQKAERGSNKYFRCSRCGDVFVYPPESDIAYRIPGVKEKR